jgi:hypothetical protein
LRRYTEQYYANVSTFDAACGTFGVGAYGGAVGTDSISLFAHGVALYPSARSLFTTPLSPPTASACKMGNTGARSEP